MMLNSTLLLLARIKVKFHGWHFEDGHDLLVFLGIILLFIIGVKLLISVAKAVEMVDEVSNGMARSVLFML